MKYSLINNLNNKIISCDFKVMQLILCELSEDQIMIIAKKTYLFICSSVLYRYIIKPHCVQYTFLFAMFPLVTEKTKYKTFIIITSNSTTGSNNNPSVMPVPLKFKFGGATNKITCLNHKQGQARVYTKTCDYIKLCV